MKTTIEIPNALFTEAKRCAAARGITFREVVEAGLRQFLESNRSPAPPFRLRKATFRGRGMVENLDWNAIQEMIYEGRGGREP